MSGLLAAETRKWDGIELKFIEPAEARMPDKKWRLYEFKGDEQTKVRADGVVERHWRRPFEAPRQRLTPSLSCAGYQPDAGAPSSSHLMLPVWARSASSQVPRVYRHGPPVMLKATRRHSVPAA